MYIKELFIFKEHRIIYICICIARALWWMG